MNFRITILQRYAGNFFGITGKALSLCFCIFLSITFVQAAELRSEVDRTIIGADETLQLTVRLDEQINFNGPDFSPLDENFEILNQFRTNQFHNINGRAESWTEWTFTLAPKKEGKIIVPSLRYENAISDAIAITVTPSNQVVSGEVPNVFIETKTDKKLAYVQEQILLTYSIHWAQSEGNLREINMEELQLPNAVIEKVSENSFRRQLQGKSYYVSEVVYAIYPQQSSVLEIPGLLFTLTASSGNRSWFNDPFRNSRGNLRRLRSDAVTINVEPKPDSYTYKDWIPATNVSLDEAWSEQLDTFKVGEPITRTITLTAEGLTSAQLPPLPEQSSDSFKIYADQPQQDDVKSALGITGRRMESMAIVPTQAGLLRLPEVELGWWDTNTQQQRIARLPSRQVNVQAAALDNISPNPTPVPPVDAINTSVTTDVDRGPVSVLNWPWIIATLLCGGLALWFMLAWLKLKKQLKPKPDPASRQHHINVKNAANTLRRACADNNPGAARGALIQWAQLYWRDSRITQLQAIISRSQEPRLKRELQALDSALYGNKNAQWQGEPLWKAVVSFTRKRGREKKHQDSLAPLYPV